jgi:hypothetical protein
MVVYVELNVFLQLSLICLFGTKWAFLHLENYDLEEVSFQKLTQYSEGDNVLDHPPSKTDGCLGEIHVFRHLIWIGLVEEHKPNCTLKHLSCRAYSFQNVNQFSQKNNMLHSAASVIDDFHWKDTCISTTQQNRPIWKKMSLSPTLKLWFSGRFSFKN